MATILTMVGVAVGLGNVWRFPYMMGKFGGGAFLFVYVGFALLIATPALMAEWALGRATRRGPVGALDRAFGPAGRALGVVLVAGLVVATSYYCVVVGHVAYTAGFGLLRGFGAAASPAYQAGLDDGTLQAALGLATLGLALLVLHAGLNRGIERASRIGVPFFGVVALYLVLQSLALPGALAALGRLLRLDFASLTGTSVFAAMGQAVFSLSLGGTFFVIYGSYLQDGERLPSAAVWTSLGDTGAALLAALFIVPAAMVFGLDLESGPRLLFHTLPRLFDAIPAGRILGSAFLAALWMVAYLSVVAALQVPVGVLQETFGMRQRSALLAVGAAVAALLVPVAYNPALILPLDLAFGSGMQVAGSAIAVLALVWGLGRATTLEQLFGESGGGWRAALYHWLRWAVPAALILVLGLYFWDQL